MEDRTAPSSASTELADKNPSQPPQRSSALPNFRGLLVLLPGLGTLLLWEIAAWHWPGIARLVSQPIEITRGIVDVVTTGVIWQHFDATLKEMAAGYVIGAITGIALGFLCGRIKLLGDILNPYITKGLGFFINYNQGTYDTNGIFVGVTILALLVVVLDGLLSLAERRLLKWRPEVEAKNVGA
jgi:ABC-type nitrate/sulfonate/bicarbonate transport system permease component